MTSTFLPELTSGPDEPARPTQPDLDLGPGLPVPVRARSVRSLRLAAVVAIAASTLWLVWRVSATLDGATMVLAVPLWLLEVHALVSLVLHTLDLWDVDAGPEPGSWSGEHRVAVLVPTYNESRQVLLPTVAAAVALDVDHDTWVLDDGDRPWVRQLAADLGARYQARPVRHHAKAGNINDVLPRLRAEGVDLALVLDADHVASPDFLSRVLGYFDDESVAVVQTPQDFYNQDSFEHVHAGRFSLALRRLARRPARPSLRFNEQDLFYRGLAPGRNRTNAAFWCGTNAVVRLAALETVGDVATDSVTEDILTTVRLHRRGWSTVYHNEVLARGLAAANAEQYLSQRLRWGTGAMQVLRRERIVTGGGLTLGQRLSYLSTLTGWFESWRTLGYVLLPVLTLLLTATPIAASMWVFVPAFLAVTAVQRVALHGLARGRATVWHSMVFEFVRMSATLRATLTLFSTRDRAFVVTHKGREGDGRDRMPWPRLLCAIALGSVLSLVWFALSAAGLTPVHYADLWIPASAAVWVALNLLVTTSAVRRIRRVSYGAERRASVRFCVEAVADLDGLDVAVVDISPFGARLTHADHGVWQRGDRVTLRVTLPTGAMTLPGTVRLRVARDGGDLLGVEFTGLSMADEGRLAVDLFRTAELVDPAAPEPVAAR